MALAASHLNTIVVKLPSRNRGAQLETMNEAKKTKMLVTTILSKVSQGLTTAAGHAFVKMTMLRQALMKIHSFKVVHLRQSNRI